MNSLRRFAMLVVALAMLGATGAVSQDAVLLQYRMTEDTVRAMDVVSNQTGAAAGESQAIDATITVLSRARNVDDQGFTEDLYTVDTWIRIESAGEVLDTSEEGSELTGTGITGNRPVTTYRLDWHGRSLGGDDVPTADDPMAKLTNALQSAMGRLPSEPVAPGATWTDATSAEVGEGSAEVTVEWRFDRLAEIDGRQYAILKAEARAVCQNVDAGRKEQRIQIQGMDLHQYIDEYVENLSVAQTVEVQWDIEAGYGVKTIVDQVIQATSLITLTDADTGQVQVAGIPVEVERTGKVGYIRSAYIRGGATPPPSGGTSKYEPALLMTKTVEGSVHLRSGAGTGYSSLGTLRRGDFLKAIGKSGDWVEVVTTNKKTGYVHKSYVSFGVGARTTGDVNFRKGPGTNYSVIRTLSAGAGVTVLEVDGKWAKVRSGSATGYISTGYFSF